jgi:SAM-dependent MidA family methyltransferase
VSVVADALLARIRREGPITFDRFMAEALYGSGGFFASGQGPRRDFVTSPGLGSLFGACAARALDRWWRELGEPDPFLVVEAGAGDGRLAREILRAAPECLRALRYVLVEVAPGARAAQRELLPLEPPDEALGEFAAAPGDDPPRPTQGSGPVFASVGELPPIGARDAVLLANELLDNLPFGIAESDGSRWCEVRVGWAAGRFVEVVVPLAEGPGAEVSGSPAPAGTRVPIPRGMRAWFGEADRTIRTGVIALVDYMTDEPELRLRTYRAHRRGASPLEAPGTCDITADVVVDQLLRAAAPAFRLERISTQADWLRDLGIDALADEGARQWRAGAAVGGLDALAGRSRVHEAEALTDPGGLGAHRVAILRR